MRVKWHQVESVLTAGKLQGGKITLAGENVLDLSKRSVFVAFWDEHGLLRPPGLFQRLVPLSAALGLTCICNTKQR